MSQFGSKDFSTLDRNVAIVNDVLRTRLEYEAARAKTEKERFEEQETATQLNKLAEVTKETHQTEQWEPGDQPGGMWKKVKVDVPGPEPTKWLRAVSEVSGKLAGLGQAGQRGLGAVNQISKEFGDIKTAQAPKQAGGTGMKPGRYQTKQMDIGGTRYYEMIDTATGERKTVREGDIPPAAAVRLAQADGRQLALIVQKDGSMGIEDLGAAPEKGTGKQGGIGSGASRIVDQVTWRGGRGQDEKFSIRAFDDQDALQQLEEGKRSVESNLEALTSKSVFVPADVLAKLSPEQQKVIGYDAEKNPDGMALSVNLDGLISKDRNVSSIWNNVLDMVINQAALDEAGNAEFNNQINQTWGTVPFLKADIAKWRAFVTKQDEVQKNMQARRDADNAPAEEAPVPAAKPAAKPTAGAEMDFDLVLTGQGGKKLKLVLPAKYAESREAVKAVALYKDIMTGKKVLTDDTQPNKKGLKRTAEQKLRDLQAKVEAFGALVEVK